MDTNTAQKNVKRKKSRYFEIYISKILKTISDNGITNNAKQQFNSILCSLVYLISSKVLQLTELVNKKTISHKEVNSAIMLCCPLELAKQAVEDGQKAYDNYTINNDVKGMSRQEKSGIVFPPSIMEKFLRNFGFSKIMISSSAPIHFTGALEFLAKTILSNESHLTSAQKDELGDVLDQDE